MKTLGELLTPEERAAIRAPIDKARTLPRRAFVDADFHAFEVEHALKESWFAVTFATELPDAGDVLPLTVLGLPVLLVRGRDGLPVPFTTSAPMTGAKSPSDRNGGWRSSSRPITDGSTASTGTLLEANYWDGTPKAEGVAPDSLNADLVPIPCEEWMSTLFVHPGKRPVPFAEQYGPVLEHLKDIDLGPAALRTGRKG